MRMKIIVRYSIFFYLSICKLSLSKEKKRKEKKRKEKKRKEKKRKEKKREQIGVFVMERYQRRKISK